MADYEFKYRMMDNTKATHNGDNQIKHNIQVIARIDGTSDEFIPVQGLERTIFIPAEDALTALEYPTAQQVKDAYKQLIVDNVNSVLQSRSMPNWGSINLEAWMDANDMSKEAVATFEAFLTDNAMVYPIDFDI